MVYDKKMGKWLLVSLFLFIILMLPSTVSAFTNLDEVNQKVSLRFEEDTSRLAAIMEELRDRKGIIETRVAFGGIDNQIKSADYWITYTAEAIAFQRSKKPDSEVALKSQLQILAGKVIRAKNEVRKALDE